MGTVKIGYFLSSEEYTPAELLDQARRAEQAGFGAFGRYMHRFARSNRAKAPVLGDRAQREAVEPFLTSESFHIYFELMYELEAALRLFLGLVFNAIVLGLEIDAGLPAAYVLVFVICLTLQWRMHKVSTEAYATNQRQTNRLTAHTYTAWDNILAGNGYNYRLWNGALLQSLACVVGQRDVHVASFSFVMTTS